MKVSAKQYAQTLFEVTEGQSHQKIVQIIDRLVLVMRQNGDLTHGNNVMKAFVQIHDRSHNVVTASVTSARMLSESQKNDIGIFITRKYHASDIDLTFGIDERIKGGIIIRVGDEIIDASIKGRLMTMQHHLMSK